MPLYVALLCAIIRVFPSFVRPSTRELGRVQRRAALYFGRVCLVGFTAILVDAATMLYNDRQSNRPIHVHLAFRHDSNEEVLFDVPPVRTNELAVDPPADKAQPAS